MLVLSTFDIRDRNPVMHAPPANRYCLPTSPHTYLKTHAVPLNGNSTITSSPSEIPMLKPKPPLGTTERQDEYQNETYPNLLHKTHVLYPRHWEKRKRKRIKARPFR
jgi:hypothetical protein